MYNMGTLKKPRDKGTMFNVSLKIYSNMSGILVSLDISKPRKLQYAFNKINDLASFNKIKDLASNLGASFHHVLRSANGFVDALAKQGLLWVFPVPLWDRLYFGYLFNKC